MKARQKNNGNAKRQFLQGGENKDNLKMQSFIQNYMRCNVLYHMKIDASSENHSDDQKIQLPMLKHAFANTNALQNLPKPSLQIKATAFMKTNNKTLFDTFNHTDLSRHEDEQWVNYTKEYDSFKKASPKKQQYSPQQREKQMSLLINQFLSDISNPSIPQVDLNQSKNIVLNRQTTAKVQKIQIDLSAFQAGKSKSKSPIKKSNNSVSLEKNKKQVTPRFININEMKGKLKKPQQVREKSGSKKQIEVIKVTNLGAKTNNNQFQRHFQKVVIAKNPFRIAKDQKQIKTQKKQKIQGNAEYSYSKNRMIKQGKTTPLLNTSFRNEKQAQQNPKKPLKIQIQIPAQELNIQQQASPFSKDSRLKQLDYQSQQIIKDISQKVLTLLQKSKEIAWRGK